MNEKHLFTFYRLTAAELACFEPQQVQAAAVKPAPKIVKTENVGSAPIYEKKNISVEMDSDQINKRTVDNGIIKSSSEEPAVKTKSHKRIIAAVVGLIVVTIPLIIFLSTRNENGKAILSSSSNNESAVNTTVPTETTTTTTATTKATTKANTKQTTQTAKSSQQPSSVIIASGDCGKNGNNVKWTLDNNGVLTISGTGEMTNYEYNYSYLRSPFNERTDIKSVLIKSGVTSIGAQAFEFCKSIESVTIPSGVTSIGESAFRCCDSLESVTIPSSVTSIGECAFADCLRLTSVTIPNSVTSIGDGAFFDCVSLTSITIPSSITSISVSMFSYCSSLKDITIPDSVTYIGVYAFNNCISLTSLTIPNSVTSIGEFAFKDCVNLTIKCKSGSYAETYAKNNGSKYQV